MNRDKSDDNQLISCPMKRLGNWFIIEISLFQYFGLKIVIIGRIKYIDIVIDDNDIIIGDKVLKFYDYIFRQPPNFVSTKNIWGYPHLDGRNIWSTTFDCVVIISLFAVLAFCSFSLSNAPLSCYCA